MRRVKLKAVTILVALHNKPNFDLSRCYEFLPSIYKGFEIDVLRGVNLKTAIVFVALYKGISLFYALHVLHLPLSQ